MHEFQGPELKVTHPVAPSVARSLSLPHGGSIDGPQFHNSELGILKKLLSLGVKGTVFMFSLVLLYLIRKLFEISMDPR